MMRLLAILGLCLGCGLIACGGAGSGADNSRKRPKSKTPLPSDNEPNKRYNTSVGMALLGDGLPRLAGCGKPESIIRLRELTDFNLDGQLGEWQLTQRFIADPLADGATSQDIIGSYLAQHGGENPDLVGFVSGEFAAEADAQLVIAFGYLNSRTDDEVETIGLREERTYRLAADGMFAELVEGAWQLLDHDVASWQRGSSGIEWRMNRRQMDQVLLQPLWYHQVRTLQGTSEADVTGLRFAPAIDTQMPVTFALSACVSESSARVPLTFQQIIDKGIDGDDAEIVFGIVRLAYESLQASWDHPSWPTELLPIVLSSNPALKGSEQLNADPVQVVYEGIYIHWTASLQEALQMGRYGDLFLSTQEALVKGWLDDQRPEAAAGESAWATDVIKQWSLRQFIDRSTWLTYLPGVLEAFRQDPDTQIPVGINDRFMRLTEPFESNEAKQAYYEMTIAKTAGAAAAVSNKVTPKHIRDAWQLSQTANLDLLTAVTQILGEGFDIEPYWHGWISSEPYASSAQPDIINDDDSDGLPNFLESEIVSDPTLIDTDSDGWTDFAEYLYGTAWNNRAKVPGVILADGYFGDWQELLPTRIEPHQGIGNQGESCGRDTRIQATAGIGRDAELILAAIPESPWLRQYTVGWEFLVRFIKSRQQLIFRARSGDYKIDVLDGETLEWKTSLPLAVPVGSMATELSVDIRKLGLKDDLSRRKAVRYQVTTIRENEERLLCDQTRWLVPLANDR